MKYDRDTPQGRAMNKILRYMLDELEGNFHEVVLIPAPDPQHSTHKIRALQSANAEWYSRFAAQYVNCRGTFPKQMIRPRTWINKCRTADALARMIAGNFKGVYATRLVKFVERFRENHRHNKRRNRRESVETYASRKTSGIWF